MKTNSLLLAAILLATVAPVRASAAELVIRPPVALEGARLPARSEDVRSAIPASPAQMPPTLSMPEAAAEPGAEASGEALSAAPDTAVADSSIENQAAAPKGSALDEAITALDAALKARMIKDELPGLSISVAHEGKPVFEQAYGKADPATGLPATVDTLYRLASNSKMFTAIAVHQLVDRGAIRLDDRVVDILPWLRYRQPAARTAKITVAQLLSHTSGINREPAVEFWTNEDRLRRNRPPRAREQRAGAARQTPPYEPGARLRYSNQGYWLLGEIIAARSGAPGATPEARYRRYVTAHVLRPLGLDDSSFDVDPIRLPRVARPYGLITQSRPRRALPLLKDTGANAPGWGLVTSVRDMTKFLGWLERSINGADPGIVSKEAIARMTTPVLRDAFDPRYGHGMGMIRFLGLTGERVGHTGSFVGFKSLVMVDPVLRLSVAVASNCGDFDREAVAELVFQTIGKALGAKPVPQPSVVHPAATGPLATPDLAALAGRYDSDLSTVTLFVDSDNRLKLGQPGAAMSLTLLSSGPDRVVFRIGDDGSYTGWLGERMVIELKDGKPTAMVGAGAYRQVYVPQRPPKVL